jgi:hypothetical protein
MKTIHKLLLFDNPISYILRDDFNDTVAAGSVNGTYATDGINLRTVTDVNSKLSIGGGVLNQATGGTTSDKVAYPTFARIAGRALFFQLTQAAGDLYSSSSVATAGNVIETAGAGHYIYDGAAISPRVATLVPGTSYKHAVIFRTAGAFFYIKGGVFTNWTLLYVHKISTTTPLTAALRSASVTAIHTSDFIHIPQDLLLNHPLASDNFTAADGVLGNTRGGGVEETGGSGLAWTSQKGTWGIATNKAASSALDGTANISIATVDAGNTNVMAEVVATRTGGASGLVLRYTDASNYIKVVHNGTNLQVIEVVAGTPNTLRNVAATYGATARIVVSLRGNIVRAYYNDVLIGDDSTTAVITGSNHGIFTDNVGATFDNFVVWAKGVGNEYETFNQYTNP